MESPLNSTNVATLAPAFVADRIVTWAAAGKSEMMEFKRTTGERREAARTLCAMLNNRGGRVLCQRCNGAQPTVQLPRTGYRRVGNTIQALSREEYDRMLLERVHGEQRWENQPADGWSVADFDVAEITRTIEEARIWLCPPGCRDGKLKMQEVA